MPPPSVINLRTFLSQALIQLKIKLDKDPYNTHLDIILRKISDDHDLYTDYTIFLHDLYARINSQEITSYNEYINKLIEWYINNNVIILPPAPRAPSPAPRASSAPAPRASSTPSPRASSAPSPSPRASSPSPSKKGGTKKRKRSNKK